VFTYRTHNLLCVKHKLQCVAVFGNVLQSMNWIIGSWFESQINPSAVTYRWLIKSMSSWHVYDSMSHCQNTRLIESMRLIIYIWESCIWDMMAFYIYVHIYMQQSATRCNTKQPTATHCNTPLPYVIYIFLCDMHTTEHLLQQSATRCNTKQPIATHRSHTVCIYTYVICKRMNTALLMSQ